MKTINNKSFTLIEVLVGVGLLLIVFLGIFAAFQLGLQVVGKSKNRIIATSLANAEIEKIRNLPYQSIGVQGSFPDGVLEATSTTALNNVNFLIERRVDYVVDAADGISYPDDDCPNDYKKAEVKVSALGKFPVEVAMVSNISPKNLSEECDTRGGILSVSVFDALGQMVAFPFIEIKDPISDATLKTATPANGQHYFSLATSTYKVVVSKSGYSQERTYGTDEIANPVNPHPIVLEGEVTEVSFSIDKLSSMTVETRGSKAAGYPVVQNVTFNLRGAKVIGDDNMDNPVYKYSQNHTTNASGEITINDLEWDSYYFSVVSSGLNLIEFEVPPGGATTTQPIDLEPNSQLSVRLILTAENALLVTVEDITTLEPIFSASVRLVNTDLGYDTTQYTDERGQTYFIPLEGATYDIDVQAAGYASSTSQVLVSGETASTIQLQEIE